LDTAAVRAEAQVVPRDGDGGKVLMSVQSALMCDLHNKAASVQAEQQQELVHGDANSNASSYLIWEPAVRVPAVHGGDGKALMGDVDMEVQELPVDPGLGQTSSGPAVDLQHNGNTAVEYLLLVAQTAGTVGGTRNLERR
jgi:hypothetical protein